MKSTNNTSIRKQITGMIMLISGITLFIACAALFAMATWNVQKNFTKELTVTGQMLAKNVAVAAMFNDEEKAAEILGGLEVLPQIVRARLVLEDETELAGYSADGSASTSFPDSLQDNGIHTEGHRMLLVQPVAREGRKIGVLFIEANFAGQFNQLLMLNGSVLAIVLSCSLVLSFFLSNHLQRFVTQPILELTAVARSIAQGKDYSKRAPLAGPDEVGTLSEAFNLMLDQIQAQDAALKGTHEELEDKLAALEASQSAQRKLIAINDATPDFVGMTDANRRTAYLNKAAREMVGLPNDVDLSAIDIADFYTDRARKMVENEGLPTAIQEGYWTGETALKHADGHEIYVSQVIIAHLNTVGELESFSTVMRDVSERKAAEEELRLSQMKLLETSRKAGKAEVATNVLHNVGNVLNSVNVSGNLINERLRGSKLSALNKTAAMIEAHREDFGVYVTDDPKGRLLPDLVPKIAKALTEEHQQLLAEVELINNHIGHIKEIVAMQQSNSKAGGVIEKLKVAALVEDSLRINSASIMRHKIQVVQDFEEVPLVHVDKHKAMQILVNLLSNAKHALEDSQRDDKMLTVKIRNNGGSFVKIIIEDNGVGIPEDNLTRIFAHGFTTKDAGHGFGLHHGALAAKELGGALHARSDGQGRGAAFTLELPISAPAAAI